MRSVWMPLLYHAGQPYLDRDRLARYESRPRRRRRGPTYDKRGTAGYRGLWIDTHLVPG
jgi:hypothetical protein